MRICAQLESVGGALSIEKRISRAKKNYAKFLDKRETILWADEFYTLLTDVRLVSFKPLFLKAFLDGSAYEIAISMPIGEIEETERPTASGTSTDIKLKSGKLISIKSPLRSEEIDEFVSTLLSIAKRPQVIEYLQTVTPEIRAEIRAASVAEEREAKVNESEQFESNFGSVVASKPFATKRITIYSQGFVRVDSGMGAAKGSVEKLLDIFGETDITRKSGLGRAAGAVLTAGANVLLSPGQRGNVYLTITTDRDTHSIMWSRPDAYSIKTMNELVSAGKSVIARANSAINSASVAHHNPVTPVDIVSQLEKLAGLRDSGVLSEEEFTAAKAKLIEN